MRKAQILVGGLLLWCRTGAILACDTPIVQTQSGSVQGSAQRGVTGAEFCSFKGIPYAKSPVDELRFEASVRFYSRSYSFSL